MKFSWFALYCGLLLSISAFSIDILLPLLSGISIGLNAGIEQTQLIIPIYMLALGLGNPVYGALSDRFGRRFGIFLGLGLYMIGTLLCFVAASIEMLFFGRFIQGLGASAAPVISRAMIRDRYQGVELAQTMAVVSMFFALGPMLAPLIGYLIYDLIGWRAVFFVLMLLALVMMLATYKQPETLPLSKRQAQSLGSFWQDIVRVFKQPQSLYFIGISCFCSCLILTFLSYAPIVYTTFGTSPGKFAVLFALSAIAIVFGQTVNHHLISRFGSVVAATCGSVVIAVSASIIWFSAFTGTLNEILFTVLMFAFGACFQIVFSNIVSLTLDPHPLRAGTASAMLGFVSSVTGALMAGAITMMAGENIVVWSACFLVIAIVILLALIRYLATHPAIESTAITSDRTNWSNY